MSYITKIKNYKYMRKTEVNSLVFLLLLFIEIAIFYNINNLSSPFPFGNDNLKLSMPLRYIESNAIQNGYFPWWNPFSGGGAPFHTLYMSNGFSPIVLILSFYDYYDSDSFRFEILFLNLLCFTGSYLWVRMYCSRVSSYLAAFTYSLSPFMMLQSALNIEAVGSAISFPWILLGINLILKCKKIGIFIFASSLSLCFTHGYLGLNYFFIVFLIVFLILLKLIYRHKVESLKLKINSKIIVVYFLVSAVIFVGTLLPIIYETYTNLNINYFLRDHVDPFAVSTQISSIYTIFDTKSISPFEPDINGGHKVFLYLPSIILFGVFFSFIKINRIILVLIAISIFIFFTALSREIFLTQIIINNIPGFNSIRLHSWLIPILYLPIILIAAMGLDNFNLMLKANFKKALLICLIFITNYIFLYIIQPEFKFQFTYFLIMIVGAFVFSIIILLCVSCEKYNHLKYIFVLSLIFITVAQMYIANSRWDKSGLNARIPTIEEQIKIKKSYEKEDKSITVINSQRELNVNNDSEPYINNKIVVNSYMPQRNPIITKMIIEGLENKLVNYIYSPEDMPINSKIKLISTNKFNFEIQEIISFSEIMLTIPYSSNWKAKSGNISIDVLESREGLINLKLPSKAEEIELEYRSPFHPVLLKIYIICWCLILLGFVCNIYSYFATNVKREY